MKRRVIVYLVLVAVTIWWAALTLPDRNLHVIFCDVGQGDAILVTWGRVQILVDGGPDDEVVDCMERHMSFFDKRIELAVLTHPESDHLTGLMSVFKRYSVMHFVGVEDGEAGELYEDLNGLIDKKRVVRLPFVSGGMVGWSKQGKGLKFEIVWPTKEFIEDAGGVVDGNQMSRVGRVTFGEFEVLLAGDADAPVQIDQLETGDFGKVEVLKVPHHGSRTGMTDEWLESLQPDLAVISVGENTYGHPTVEALAQLSEIGADVVRTDIDGDIEVVSDGVRWWLK